MGERDAERERMIQDQLQARGLTHRRVLAALRLIPREAFVPVAQARHAYDDAALAIGLGQTISQPYMVALMTAELDPQPTHRVLEIGTGTGYQTAILCQLAGEVFSVERLAALSVTARERLDLLKIHNAHFVVGDGSVGLADHAPFERILVTAAAPRVPAALLAQLAPGGRLVIPVGGPGEQDLLIVDKPADGPLHHRHSTRCRFVPLIGVQGFPDDVR